MEIKEGSIVVLKSGGPQMTVQAFVGDDRKLADCVYWAMDQMHRDNFYVAALKTLDRS